MSDRTRDAWWVLRCQAGEAAALAEIVAAYETSLRYYATKLTGDEHAALDVLQEAWLKIFRGVRRLQQPETLRPWLYATVHGLACDWLRRKSVRRQVIDTLQADWSESSGETDFTADDAEEIHRALDQLEFSDREVLTLQFLEDLSIAEIAAVIGCPEGTVKSRLSAARRALRRHLERRRSDV